MTPLERAENIKATLLPLVDLGPSIVDFLAAQIEEAERAAVTHAVINMSNNEGVSIAYAEGFRAARDKAKGIIQSWTVWTPGHIEKLAQRIGEMEP